METQPDAHSQHRAGAGAGLVFPARSVLGEQGEGTPLVPRGGERAGTETARRLRKPDVAPLLSSDDISNQITQSGHLSRCQQHGQCQPHAWHQVGRPTLLPPPPSLEKGDEVTEIDVSRPRAWDCREIRRSPRARAFAHCSQRPQLPPAQSSPSVSVLPPSWSFQPQLRTKPLFSHLSSSSPLN